MVIIIMSIISIITIISIMISINNVMYLIPIMFIPYTFLSEDIFVDSISAIFV